MKFASSTAALGLALGLCGLSVPAFGQTAPAQTLVPASSEVTFVARQLGVPIQGRFQRFTVRSQFDPKAPQTSRVGIEIDLGSVSLNPDADAELPKPEWFNTAKFPKATFQSVSIRATGPGRFEAKGKLSIKGLAQDVTVPVQITPAAGTSGVSTATGAFSLKRTAFKVGDGDWADTSIVADDVQVRFKFALKNMPAL